MSVFLFFFSQLSWNKLPAILCSVQVSRLPFTHTHLCSLSANWGLYLKFCLRVYTAVVLAELQWIPCAPTGCSIPLRLNNWVLHSRSLHMGSSAHDRQKKAAEIVSCYLISVAMVQRSIKTLLGGSDSLLQNRESVLLVFAVINLSGFFFFLLWFCVFLCVCTRLVALPPECLCSGNLRLFPLKSFEDQQAFPPGATAVLEEPVAAEVFRPIRPTLVIPYLTTSHGLCCLQTV